MDIPSLLTHTCSAVVLYQPTTVLSQSAIVLSQLALSQPISQPPLTIVSPPNTPPLPPPGQPSTCSTSDAPFSLKPTFVDTGGATSFASRNPLKDVQPPRVRVRNSKSDAVKLGQAAKIAARAQKLEELNIGVDAIIKSREGGIKKLSEELDVSEWKIQKLVNGERHYKKHREPNMFNALVHKVTEEMNTGDLYFFLIKLPKTDENSYRS